MTFTELSKFGLPYLASPYSKYSTGPEMAFIDVTKLVARLANSGLPVFSPITYTHPIAVHGKINPLDHDYWLGFDDQFIAVCGSLLVAKMDGWDESFGICEEKTRFARLGKPTFYLNPETLEVTQ